MTSLSPLARPTQSVATVHRQRLRQAAACQPSWWSAGAVAASEYCAACVWRDRRHMIGGG